MIFASSDPTVPLLRTLKPRVQSARAAVPDLLHLRTPLERYMMTPD